MIVRLLRSRKGTTGNLLTMRGRGQRDKEKERGGGYLIFIEHADDECEVTWLQVGVRTESV